MINLPVVTHEGNVSLGGVVLSIVVLNDGRRMVLKKSIFKLFGKTGRGRIKKKKPKVNLLSFVDVDRFSDLMDNELKIAISTAKFFSIDNTLEEGYVVNSIPKLCKLFFVAKKKKLLNSNDSILAERAEIIALELEGIHLKYFIDRSINFGFKKENDQMLSILKSHFSKNQFILWAELFEDVCFKELFRLNGWEYNITEIRKRPTVISKWMLSLVFEQLPKTVNYQISNESLFDEMLSKETRDLYLVVNSQITTIQTLLKISNNMKELWKYLVIIKKRDTIQITRPFDFDESGFTLEPKDDSFLSEFNKTLKTILSFEAKSK